jgi:hypothetical protein
MSTYYSFYSFDGMPWSVPEPQDDRLLQEDDDADLEWQAAEKIIQQVSVSDILRDTADLLTDEPLSSPIVQLLEVWLSDALSAYAPGSMAATPIECERIGRHMAGLLQAIVEKHLLRARQRADGRA